MRPAARRAVLGAGVVCLVLVMLVAIKAAPHRAAHTRPVRVPGNLVVLVMPTLSWGDISPEDTPALWRIARTGAVANLATRAHSAPSCTQEGLLTLGAGTQTVLDLPRWRQLPGLVPGGCPEALSIRRGPAQLASLPSWFLWRQAALSGGTHAAVGRLASLLEERGDCVSAAGQQAAMAAADIGGSLGHYTPRVRRVDTTSCPVTFITLPGPDDSYLRWLRHRLAPGTTLVVTGLADQTTTPSLRAVAATGPGIGHGSLTSLSTRQSGLIQPVDISAMAYSLLGSRAPTLSEGRMPRLAPDEGLEAVNGVQGLQHALDVEYPLVPVFFALYLGGALLAAGVGALAWRAHHRRHPTRPMHAGLRRWFAVVGALTAATPVSTWLVGLLPWWRLPLSGAFLILGVAAIAVGLALLALRGPWRQWVAGPVVCLTGISALVVGVDVMMGSHLQFISLMGLQPVYGGRFFGQGNVGYAVFATCALLLAACLGGRLLNEGRPRLAALVVGVVGLVAILVDGAPNWGADGGGPVAMIPAFAYLALNAAGHRLSWRRVGAIALATFGIVVGFAFLDYLRPQQYRTHLGDAVTSLLDTGRVDAVARIVTENWTMLFGSPLNFSVVVVLLGLILALALPRIVGRPLRPMLERVRLLDNGLAAVIVCWLLGFAANDSGTVIPPTGLLVTIPVMVLLAARLPVGPPRDVPAVPAVADVPAAPAPEPQEAGVDGGR